MPYYLQAGPHKGPANEPPGMVKRTVGQAASQAASDVSEPRAFWSS